RLSRAAGRGAPPRPPEARSAAGPLPPRRELAGLAVLAPEGNGDLERAGGPAPSRERETRVRRGEDPAPLRHRDLHHLRPLRELPGEHVLRQGTRGREADGAEADELPRPH